MKVIAVALIAVLAVQHAVLVSADDSASPSESVVPTAIHRFMAQPDPEFAWKKLETLDTAAGRVHLLNVTSQKWQDITWQHAVEVYEPKKLTFPNHALLFVTGGSKPGTPSERDLTNGLQLAEMCGSRVVMLHQVPNQPLLGGKKEDDLISDTWLRYLETGDETWPLLFPMVKSAVRTMDAVQDFARTESSAPIQHFVITGASKRGWTSWLTPVADKRIVATAPIVIDVLNFRAQMNHQLATWGEFSEQIIDYTSKGLIKRPDQAESPREARLRLMMDPYTYRNQLTLPKLLIVGTNDPYWVADAMNLYWDDLVGSKHILQVPNAGHSLDGGRDGALTTLAVFFRHIASGSKLPELSWKFSGDNEKMKLVMNCHPAPAKARLWTAQSTDADFRDDRWEATEIGINGADLVGTTMMPTNGHTAIFGEVEFDFHGTPWSLTTLIYRQ